jgi:hypothetical protein
MRSHSVARIALFSLSMAACTTLPGLQEATGGIPLREIVLRIKCELSDAFRTVDGKWLPESDQGKFAWLKYWTAQVDLTLQVLDTATLSPGASLTQPFHNGYATRAGPTSISTSGVPGTTIAAIPQNFVIAAGASLNGQAQRTETISFAVALRELEAWRRDPSTPGFCAVSDGMDLGGRLGLKEWVVEALSPVAKENEPLLPEYLWAGIHPKPGAAPPSAQNPTKEASPNISGAALPKAAAALRQGCTAREDLVDKINVANTLLKDAFSEAPSAVTTSNAAKNSAESNLNSSDKTLMSLINSFSDYARKNSIFGEVLDPSIRSDIRILQNSANQFMAGAKQLHFSIKKTANATSSASDEANSAAEFVIQYRDKFNQANQLATETAQNEDKEKIKKGCDLISEVLTNADRIIGKAASAKYYTDVATKDAAATASNFSRFNDYTNVASDYLSKLPSIDPPISTIGQSMQFILNYGGSVSPTWMFVVFHGPTSPLFAAAGTRTHILSLTLGPTVPGSFSAPSAAVTQNQLYLLLNNLLPSLAR